MDHAAPPCRSLRGLLQSRPRFAKELPAYLALFAAGRSCRWRGESSTAYFWDPPAAGRIKAFNPLARIVISLRDPADRAYSEYLHNIQTGNERRLFLAAIHELLARRGTGDPRGDFLASGFYLRDLQRYLDAFGERVHVLFFEDLKRDPRAALRKIFSFLGVDTDAADDLDVTGQNRSFVPRRGAHRLLMSPALRAVPEPVRRRAKRLLLRDSPPAIPPAARALLDELYADEREPLAHLLRRPLPW